MEAIKTDWDKVVAKSYAAAVLVSGVMFSAATMANHACVATEGAIPAQASKLICGFSGTPFPFADMK